MPSSLVVLWVSCVLRAVVESLGPQCDNGKLFLEKDLPESAVQWDCPEIGWLQSAQRSPLIIDTWYDPEPASQICMDQSMSYNHTIPNSGSFRPVRAESGEYLYCPPQRWLNNLHHAGVVLLYHPCAPLHERLLLSALARSCLQDYIITPHKELNTLTPIVLVSWGRTLELSTIATFDVCDWLEATTSTRNKSADLSTGRSYNLLLTWSAETHRKRHAHPEEYSAQTKELLRRCCEKIIFSLLNGAVEPQVENAHVKESLKRFRDKGKIRRSRASMRKQRNNSDEGEKKLTMCASKFLSGQTNRTLTGDVQNYNCTLRPLKDLPSENRSLLDLPETLFKVDSIVSSPDRLDFLVGKPGQYNQTDIPKNMSVSLTDEGEYLNKLRHKDSSKHPIDSGKNTPTNDMADNHVVDDSTKKTWSQAKAAFVYKGMLKIHRNDEALWAAAALGFLLVLLTLSVLHTRLYRHWRTSPSLYWHDPKLDYDTVADVIHRRIQMAKRRLKRGRRKECIFLQSSSSSDEHP